MFYLNKETTHVFNQAFIERTSVYSSSIRNGVLNGLMPEVYSGLNNIYNKTDIIKVKLISNKKENIYEKSKKYINHQYFTSSDICFDENCTEKAAILQVVYDTGILSTKSNQTYLFYTVILILTFVISYYIIVSNYKVFFETIESISEYLTNKNHNELKRYKYTDLNILLSKIHRTVQENEAANLKLLKYYENEKIFTLARQVAHDIRSPLSALDMIVATNPESLPLAEKQIFNSAIKRIHDIANNLLIKGKTHDNQNTVENKKENTVFHLPTILESLISEKRAEFRQYNLLSIDFNINENNFDIFTSIDAVELKRIISNLINNSNEASKNECKILITLRKDDTSTILTISDNGPGIPNEVLQKINSNESITTKALGNGLGLKNARETILSNHGDFKIENHHGSIITITLPHISTPLWFLDKINLLQEKIIIIDDEISIFQAWQKRFDGKNISHLGGFEIFNNEEANYFIDYEFSTKDYNGLDKIIEHKIKNAVLVTSHFEDESIQAKCIKNNIKIIPKNLIPFITIVEKENSLIVLIDDDDLIHLVWKKEAKKRNINLIAFKSVHDFLSSSLGLDKNINIYIDSNLGESQKGEELSKNIFEKGFENIYLCSGDNQIELKKYPWIKGMSGKGFPTYNFQT